jgi:site-specific recombinase XerC
MKLCEYFFMTPSPRGLNDGELRYPQWFLTFMADRAIRKPSPHTVKAYERDFAAIATLLAGAPNRVEHLTSDAITKDAMQAAFAACAGTHAAASIRRCWSNWNTLCDFLYTAELIPANPMPLIGRPKVTKTLSKGLGAETVADLLTNSYRQRPRFEASL